MMKSKNDKHKKIEEKYSVTVNNLENEITETEKHLQYLRNERSRLFKEIIECNNTIYEEASV